jgi:RNA polymerase sigma factor (sigma-70 family)
MDTNSEFADRELLDALRLARPSDQAIRQLYVTCFRMARSYVVKNGGNEQDAEDSFQEAVICFIELVQTGKFRGDSSVSSCIYSITRHLWLNELRRKGRSLKREASYDQAHRAPSLDLHGLLAEQELKSRLMDMVTSLGETCRKILVAFYYDSLPMKEIMDLVHYQNEQVLRNKKYKCMQQLEQALKGKKDLLQYFKSALYNE